MSHLVLSFSFLKSMMRVYTEGMRKFAQKISRFLLMSWFKGAFDKVKEKSAAVKDIAKEVAHKTKEVRSRLIGNINSAELEVCLN